MSTFRKLVLDKLDAQQAVRNNWLANHNTLVEQFLAGKITNAEFEQESIYLFTVSRKNLEDLQ